MFCLFFCPKDWGQNFTQNDVEYSDKFDFSPAQNNSSCSEKFDFSPAQSDVECPVNQICIGRHPYSTENEKSKVCVKKAYKSPIRAGILFANSIPHGKKKSSGKNRGGYGYIHPSDLIADSFFVNSNGDKDIEYSIFNNMIGIHVVYLFFDCSGNHSWIGFFMNSLEVCKPIIKGDFYFHRDEKYEGFTRSDLIYRAKITDKIIKHKLPFN